MTEFADLRADTRRIWDANAEWWDDRIGDGNQFQLELIEPTTLRLLGDLAGKAVLDVGCGAGRLGRMIAQRAARVVGIDVSERFVARARKRTAAEMTNIEYRVLDACDREALAALGEGAFDAAVATMSIMDMPCIEPLFHALPRLLRGGAIFVFTLCHPCFQSPGMSQFIETRDEDGVLRTTRGVKISRYLASEAVKGIGIIGQPEAQYYFHRPLSALLGAAFASGFVMDALEEPALTPVPGAAGRVRWDDMPQIPPLLSCRLRLA